jgi:hypothetical protein
MTTEDLGGFDLFAFGDRRSIPRATCATSRNDKGDRLSAQRFSRGNKKWDGPKAVPTINRRFLKNQFGGGAVGVFEESEPPGVWACDPCLDNSCHLVNCPGVSTAFNCVAVSSLIALALSFFS